MNGGITTSLALQFGAARRTSVCPPLLERTMVSSPRADPSPPTRSGAHGCPRARRHQVEVARQITQLVTPCPAQPHALIPPPDRCGRTAEPIEGPEDAAAQQPGDEAHEQHGQRHANEQDDPLTLREVEAQRGRSIRPLPLLLYFRAVNWSLAGRRRPRRRGGRDDYGSRSIRSSAVGRVMVNDVPAPGEVSRVIVPPWAATSSATMARPSPVPRRGWHAVGSACQNRSKA